MNIIFVSGYLCSGKGTYCAKTGLPVISVSSIVKELVGKATRAELQDSAHLATTIASHIKERILLAHEISLGPRTDKNPPTVIVDGIRQAEIFRDVMQWINSHGWTYSTMWMETSREECSRRFAAKSDGKENITFDEAFERDARLGLLDLERLWKTTHACVLIVGRSDGSYSFLAS